MSLVVDVRNVTWKREDKIVLQNMNWQVDSGEHWAILGLNGSGKTTLLNMITGYIWPTEGQVSVLGHEYGTVDLRELRKSIGWVSSSLQERLHMNDRTQHVVLSGKHATIGLYDKPDDGDLERAQSLMKQLGVSHLYDRHYHSCSQGEKQKVLIARALMASPKLLILDEPCNGLDVFSREQLLSSIQNLVAQPDAPNLIYVTHHIEEIIPAFTKALLVRSGQIYRSGPTQEVLTGPYLTDFFQAPVEVEWRYDRAWLRVVS
ncbi:ABC transporter ATP-binding protein [Paenibacillus hemerocallicola]|jgi:iron complex transport system ATP-binding protein|uniref:ABC transporter ATP-binding protein n=1 Tax=Paenibacillus hemerocallicola TaxID=1172614 RepID=A0A5C4SYX1_9BACL|nr:ABC transporter ATP-binding protein [Paenibacillus hemerocallicola]TNJ61876.1 ABC transporter ATP-binding protein [Paenibacillus hemerocallicola]